MITSDRRMDVSCNNKIDTAIRKFGLVLSTHRSIKVRREKTELAKFEKGCRCVLKRERQPKGMEGKRKVGKRIAYNWKCRKKKSLSQRPDSSKEGQADQLEERWRISTMVSCIEGVDVGEVRGGRIVLTGVFMMCSN